MTDRQAISAADMREAEALPAEVRAIVSARLRVLALYLGTAIEAGHGRIYNVQRAFCTDFNARRIAFEADIYQEIASLSPATLRRWWKLWREHGARGLAPSWGCRQHDGIVDRDSELRDFLAAMIAARPHISTAGLMGGLRARFGADPRFGADRSLPGARTVQRWAARWREQHASALLAIADPDAWRSKFQSAAGSRSEGIVRPNQLWELDSTIGDLLLRDPDSGKPRRWALIKLLDVATRRTMMLVAPSSTAAGIAALIRKAILAWGVPEAIKTDNGADYTSRAIESIVEGLGIGWQICPPFTPECKPHVERCFKTFQHGLVELLPGYAGHDVAGRKAIESRRAFAQRLGNSDRTIEATLTPADFQAVCDRWCEDIYAHRVHASLGRSPFAAAAAWTGPLRRIADERALDILLLPASGEAGHRVVAKKGIHIAGGTYAHGALGALVGETVRVLTDPADLGHVYVFAADGSFICEAESPVRRGISAAEVAGAKRQIQRREVARQKAELRRRMREVKTDDIAAEILTAAGEAAGKIVRGAFGRPAEPHETAALAEAGRAARSGDFEMRRESVEEARTRAELAAPHATPRAVPDPFARARNLERAAAAGVAVTAADLAWLERYRASAEYRSRARLEELRARRHAERAG